MTTKIKIWKPLDTIGGKYWFENLLLTDERFRLKVIYTKNRDCECKLSKIIKRIRSLRAIDKYVIFVILKMQVYT